MTETGIAGLLMILTNVVFSYQGFYKPGLLDQYKFEVDAILVRKDYRRMITSGFLHVSWWHLLFNMISLYAFSGLVESALGLSSFLFIYFFALLSGNALALYIHRHNSSYSAVGASGAVSGLVFASLALFPGIGIGIPFLPVMLPGWLYAVGYMLYTIFGIQSKRDNIGHEAHLGGALAGLLAAIAFEPRALAENYVVILAAGIPALVFLYIAVTRPHLLVLGKMPGAPTKKYQTIEDRYNDQKISKQQEIDRILEKVFRSGMDSLSKKEKQVLEEHSRKMK